MALVCGLGALLLLSLVFLGHTREVRRPARVPGFSMHARIVDVTNKLNTELLFYRRRAG